MDATWTPPPLNGWCYQPPSAAARSNLAQERAASSSLLTSRRFVVSGDADEQARKKVASIQKLVVRPALGPGPHGLAYTRKLLAEILGGTPKTTTNGYHQSAMAVRIFTWVQGHIRYVKDPVGKELFQQLPAVIEGGVGDCDDFTAILAALFSAAGIKVRARLIKTKRGGPWAHIYLVAWLDGKWRAFDGALPQVLDHRVGKAGFEYPNPAQRMDLEVA